MTLIELIDKLDGWGLVITDPEEISGRLNDSLNVDPETPIPVWNETAQAWEV